MHAHRAAIRSVALNDAILLSGDEGGRVAAHCALSGELLWCTAVTAPGTSLGANEPQPAAGGEAVTAVTTLTLTHAVQLQVRWP
jgi:hypothetical protein